MKKFAIAAAAAVVAASAPAFAIDQEGNWELQLAGSGSNDVDFDAGGFSVQAQLGYFFTDQWQVAVRQLAQYSDSGEDNIFGGSTRLGGYYHFNFDDTQAWVPYAGVNVGYIYGDAFVDTWVAGPEAGLRYFVNDTTFIGASVAYEWLFDDADDAEDNFEDGQFVYSLAIGFQW